MNAVLVPLKTGRSPVKTPLSDGSEEVKGAWLTHTPYLSHPRHALCCRASSSRSGPQALASGQLDRSSPPHPSRREGVSFPRPGNCPFPPPRRCAGSCCVDEVAAKHVNADAVIHYGPACLSPVSHMPAKFVFGKGAIDGNP